LLGIPLENEIRRDLADGLVKGNNTEPGHRILDIARDQTVVYLCKHQYVKLLLHAEQHFTPRHSWKSGMAYGFERKQAGVERIHYPWADPGVRTTTDLSAREVPFQAKRLDRGRMVDLEIRDACPHELSVAAAVLSRGMRDNPLHLSVFGLDPGEREKKLENFFHILLVWMPHPPWVGARHGTIVAVCGTGGPGSCQPTFSQSLNMVTRLAPPCGVASTLRTLPWLGEWSLRDPKEAHWHLGPLCVDAPLQGRGIGSQLMGKCCRLLDAHRAAGYLETDKEYNAVFYEKFGFETIAKAKVLRTPNSFMWRDAK
jgi:ribosomal protein S18 acetylase RimI-like enzyme